MSLLLCGWLDRIKGAFDRMTEKHSSRMFDHNFSLSNAKNTKCRFERHGEAQAAQAHCVSLKWP